MDTNFTFHFGRFVNAVIASQTGFDSATSYAQANAQHSDSSSGGLGALLFVQKSTNRLVRELAPGVEFDSGTLLDDIAALMATYCETLTPEQAHVQALNLEALRRFLSGELTWG